MKSRWTITNVQLYNPTEVKATQQKKATPKTIPLNLFCNVQYKNQHPKPRPSIFWQSALQKPRQNQHPHFFAMCSVHQPPLVFYHVRKQLAPTPILKFA